MKILWWSAVLLSSTLGAGCGEFVKCESDNCGLTEGGSVVVGDQATRDACTEATRLDHVQLEGLLARYTQADGDFVYLDYAALASSPDGALALDQYIGCASLVDPAKLVDQTERRAFWFNVYNATVIRGVVANLAIDADYSVADNNFIFFSVEDHSFAGIEGMSLDQMEHIIVRADPEHEAYINVAGRDAELLDRLLAQHALLFDGAPDARLHVALNCGARGCPNLSTSAPYAFTSVDLETQLDRAARAFANNASKGAGPQGISRLFDWFEKDWVGSYGDVETFLTDHRDDGLNGVDTAAFIDYDWTLNRPP